MKLLIAEKPDAAKRFAAVLGAGERKRGYFEGGDWQVSYALGHLVGAAEPEHYKKDWKQWRLEDLPLIPPQGDLQLVVAADRKDQFNVLAALLKGVDEVYNACDCGAEGELIFCSILEVAGYQGKVKRLWYSSLVPDELRRALAAAKDGADYRILLDCARLRRRVDWVYGLSLTRAMTLSRGGGNVLHTGRVSTPTLAEIVRRTQAVQGFVPEPYQVLEAEVGSSKLQSERLDAEQADKLAGVIKASGGQASLELVVELTQEAVPPHRLFSLETLQMEANRVLGLKAKATLEGAQKLYEAGAITYPRSNSEYLPEDFPTEDLQKILAQVEVAATVIDATNRRIFDSAKIEDHHALIPIVGEGQEQDELYRLIHARFVQAFQADARREIREVKADWEGVVLQGREVRWVEQGWRDFYPYLEQKEEGEFLALEEGSAAAQVVLSQRRTSPPKTYTDASLIGFMKSPKEGVPRGLGTPATRAGIISELHQRGYFAYEGRGGKRIVATAQGQCLIAEQLPELQDPSLSADLEASFAELEAGKLDYVQARDRFDERLRSLTEKMRAPSFRCSGRSCPDCGGELLYEGNGLQCAGCPYHFALRAFGMRLEPEDIAALLRGEATELREWQGKKGPFRARLLLVDGSLRISNESGFRCPHGDHPLRSGPYGVYCGDCSCGRERAFSLPGQWAGRDLSEADWQAMLENGQTEVLDFKGKKGPYRARVCLEAEQGKISLAFEQTARASKPVSKAAKGGK